jgi:sulfoxide reductase heme-binding subunit YedZ
VPFASDWAPLWIGLGALSFDVLAAVVVTSLLRGRIPYRLWRQVHWLAYAAWPLALVHGLGAGTDTATPWMRSVEVACLAVVGAVLSWRVLALDEPSARTTR